MSSSFTDTRWSLVERSRGEGETARVALSELCAAYYAPVHRFVLSWCRDEERAKDFTQDFFARVLAEQSLGEAKAERGRFRSYLLGAVKHFLCASAESARTQKRGGAATHEALDVELSDARTLPPDALFDQQWALALLDTTLARVQSEMETEGKGTVFAVLKPWLAGQADHGQTASAAKSLGVTETAVRVLLHRLRVRFRETLRAEMAQTLGDGADVEAEMQHLFAALRG